MPGGRPGRYRASLFPLRRWRAAARRNCLPRFGGLGWPKSPPPEPGPAGPWGPKPPAAPTSAIPSGRGRPLALDLSMSLRVLRIYQRRSTGARMNVSPPRRAPERLPLSRLASGRRLTPASLGPRGDLQSRGHRPCEAYRATRAAGNRPNGHRSTVVRSRQAGHERRRSLPQQLGPVTRVSIFYRQRTSPPGATATTVPPIPVAWYR